MHPLAVEIFLILAWMTGASIAQQRWCVKPTWIADNGAHKTDMAQLTTAAYRIHVRQ